MDIRKYTSANRDAWNEVAPIHQNARKEDYEELFRKKDYSTLDDIITSKLIEVELEGKHVAQLCCNNGREVLSLINMGAQYGAGFDISDEAIKEANELKKSSNLNCRFICCDVYDIDSEYHNSFDLIYISIGALPWLPDIAGFFNIVSRMLKTGGILVIYESHPINDMLACEGDKELEPDNPFKPVYSYFKDDPWIENDGIDYIGKTIYKSKTTYCFHHKLSDIFNAVIKGGIAITEFTEYPHDISNGFEHIQDKKIFPLCYILIGKKSIQ